MTISHSGLLFGPPCTCSQLRAVLVVELILGLRLGLGCDLVSGWLISGYAHVTYRNI